MGLLWGKDHLDDRGLWQRTKIKSDGNQYESLRHARRGPQCAEVDATNPIARLNRCQEPNRCQDPDCLTSSYFRIALNIFQCLLLRCDIHLDPTAWSKSIPQRTNNRGVNQTPRQNSQNFDKLPTHHPSYYHRYHRPSD